MRVAPESIAEFYGVEDFAQGDNPRFIYWRRGARAGTLGFPGDDARFAPANSSAGGYVSPIPFIDAHAMVERSIAMAASLATVALDQGLSVGLCVWSGESGHDCATRGKRHRDDLLSVFSRLPLNTEHSVHELVDAARRCFMTGRRRSCSLHLTSKRPVARAGVGACW